MSSIPARVVGFIGATVVIGTTVALLAWGAGPAVTVGVVLLFAVLFVGTRLLPSATEVAE